MRILFVSDRRLLVESFVIFARSIRGCEIVTRSYDEALQLNPKSLYADAVLFDVADRNLKRKVCTYLEREGHVPVFILSDEGQSAKKSMFLQRGAAGIIPANISMRGAVDVISLFLGGQGLSEKEGHFFTHKEEAVLACLMQGYSNKEIARFCTLELSTTKYHVKNICQKLGAKNRLHAALLAREISV